MKQIPTEHYETMAKSHVMGGAFELMMKQDDDGVINVRIAAVDPAGDMDTLLKTEVQL